MSKMLSLQNHCHLVFLMFFIFCFHPHLSSSAPSATIPHAHQCHALLVLKSNLVIDASAPVSSKCVVPYPKTESWKEGTDCCSWDGVDCDPESGHVFGLSLSCSHLRGTIHSEISQLSHLIYLDLSYNVLAFESDRDLKNIVQNLTKLRVLNLNWLNLSSVRASSLMNLSSSLVCVRLFGCQLQGQFPAGLLSLPKLQDLDLSFNNFNPITSLPDFNSSTSISTNLRVLDLTYSTFTTSTSTVFLDFVGNHLKSLRRLYLTGCNMSGSIPPSLGNLIELIHLYLQGNLLSGHIPSSLGNISGLTHLVLGDNHFNGPIPTSFSNMTHLIELKLHDNELDGLLPSYLFALPSLIDVNLQNNKLHGQIPTSPVKSLSLTSLDLSNNNLGGVLDFDVFLNLKKLVYLDLSSNNISSSPASTSIDNSPSYSLPSFDHLDLSGCNLNQFPTFMKALTNLTYLDVSNNQIQGPIPEWMYDVGKDTLSDIDLSENLLTSVGDKLLWKNISFVDFHSNLLQGPLPTPPITTTFFSVSNNNLSGEISWLICNLSYPVVFDLSHNQFIGLIPKCLGSLSTLSLLNLGMNSLHGVIPNTFAKNNSLSSLVLNGNRLTGTVPRTLLYCHDLQILDVGNNMIEDTVPHWLETLSSLEVLVLRSNKFYGSLHSFKDKLLFPALKILDLSNNNFAGRFPIRLIKNLNAMTEVDGMTEDGGQYRTDPLLPLGLYYSVAITVKGFEMTYVKILTALATIDLSRNKFEGHIPEVIGKLISLKGLNLSYNLLTGHIPPSMGDLGNLEWLDLSHNVLDGQIPRELTDLNFLEVLDLSSNQLHGAVPHGKQFNTFGNDSYKDNLALCGFPLSKVCGSNHKPTVASENKDSSHSKDGFNWKVAFVGYGCGIVFGLSMGYVVFKKTRSLQWLVRMVERKKQHGRVGKRPKRHVKTTLFMYR